MAAIFNFWFSLITGLVIILTSATSTENFITLNLIHRDSPLSPLHNQSESNFDRLEKAFHRSLSRINRFKPDEKALESDIVPSGGEYFMRISVGTPPVEALAIADTGSDLTWVQCQPCDQCYKQDLPIYDPMRSSTYRDVLCGTKSCDALDNDARACTIVGVKNICRYTYSYGDQSFTNGNLGTENFAITGSTPNGIPLASLPMAIVFGCGTRNGGTFDEVGSGIVGLGGGPLSLVSQLSKDIGGKFSYCLVPISEESHNITSKIKFGSASVISGPDVVSTPMVSKQPDTYYYLTLEAISVGNKRLAYKHSWDGSIEKGNIIIDSGTTLTFLDSEIFNELESALEAAVNARRVSDPKGRFSICFKEENDVDIPVITAHFTGADVKLESLNTFVRAEEDLMCLSMVPSNDIAIFGNLAQMNLVVGYDLEERAVSFMPADCAKQF